MEDITPKKTPMNVSTASTLAVATKQIAHNMAILSKAPSVEIDSNDNPDQVDLYASAANNSPEPSSLPVKSGDNYFPINVVLPNNGTPAATTGSAPLTEEQKRERATWIGGILLLALVVAVVIVSLRKKH